MGRKFQASKKSGKKQDAGKAAAKKKDVDFVPKYNYFAKSVLAAYPDVDGQPFYMGDKEGPEELLSSTNIVSRSNPKNCELLVRPGMAVCLSAASIDVAIKAMVAAADNPTGNSMTKLKALLTEGSAAKAFRKAVGKLNVGKDGKLNRKKAQVALSDYVTFLSSCEGTDVWEGLVEAAQLAGRIYLGCMAALEHGAFLSKRKSFAKKLPEDKAGELSGFKKDHTDEHKLLTGLLNALMAKFKTDNGKKKGKSSGKKKGDGKKKGKNRGKKATKDSDSDGSDEGEDDEESDQDSDSDSGSSGNGGDNRSSSDADGADADATSHGDADDEDSSAEDDEPKKKKAKKADNKQRPKDADKKAGKSQKPKKKDEDDKKPNKGAANVEKKRKLMENLQNERKNAVFASWRHCEIQELSAKIDTLLTENVQLSELQDVVQSLPDNVRGEFELEDLHDVVNSMQTTPSLANSRDILNQVNEVVKAAEKFYDEQKGADAARGAGGS